jgi:hypothetical protein
MIGTAMIIGAIAGAVSNGVSSFANNKKLANAYRKAAKQYAEATEKYSGKNAEIANWNAGMRESNQLGQQDWNKAAATGTDPFNMDTSNRAAEGMNLGQQQQSQLNNAMFNKETAEAQAALKQAGIDYQVANQTQQAVANAAGGMADLYRNMKSE